MLQESHRANQTEKYTSTKTTPDPAVKEGAPQGTCKSIIPLRKEELERIARELKKKLSKASVAAKRLLTSTAATASKNLSPVLPVSLTSLPISSPLKNYYMWRRQIASGLLQKLTLLPSLYSPNRQLPTLTKPSIFLSSSPSIFLSSSPLKNLTDSYTDNGTPVNARSRRLSFGSELYTHANDSPIKRRRADSGAVVKPREPHMVLEELSRTLQSPPRRAPLHPSPVLLLNSQAAARHAAGNPKPQTTPPLPWKLPSGSLAALLKTPTQQGGGDAYNDEEGAGLLMYLATSPLLVKPCSGTTPKAPVPSSAGQNAAFSQKSSSIRPHMTGNLFIAPPPPPLTPKRHVISTVKTPQNRLMPSVYGGLNVPGSTLPSAGLTLTPAGFNMNDYVNFFTPSPGTAATQGHAAGGMLGSTLLKTPNFQEQTSNSTQTSLDGKMINFDKAELFGLAGPEQAKD